MFLLNTMRALEVCPLTLPSWKRNVNNRGLERALAILSMRSYAIGRLHDFASEPSSAGFRTNFCGKHLNGSTQKAPRQQTFKFEEVRGDTTAKRVYVHYPGSWEQCFLVAIRMVLITTFLKGTAKSLARVARFRNQDATPLPCERSWRTIIGFLWDALFSSLWKDDLPSSTLISSL